MAFVKLVKNNAHFKRFQTKYRRRREGKTDYKARLGMVVQDKNKYNTPRHRLVVRFSNAHVVCQVVRATLAGDEVIAHATSQELPRYGVTVGLANFAAAYCTGLLVARRLLKSLGLDGTYAAFDADGEDNQVEAADDAPRPFYCVLDSGLKRTSSGSKIFAALKGALDGGLDVPHSPKRFIGYDAEAGAVDAATLRRYLHGGPVGDHMEQLAEEDAAKFRAHFARYLKAGLSADNLEEMYAKAHAAIRANPDRAASTTRAQHAKSTKRWKTPKLSGEERRAALKQKLVALTA